MPRTQRLHRRFFRCESASEVRCGVSAPRTIGNLSVGEYAPEKAFAISFKGGGNPGNVGRIESESEDIHGSASA